jgi:hypothetical protein
VVATANPSAELKIYDTTSQPMSQLLAQVQQDGATIVVGPLLKDNVEDVIKSNTSLNVLALNQPEKVESRANICYFALSPEDEARDAAHIPRSGQTDAAAAGSARRAGRSGGYRLRQRVAEAGRRQRPAAAFWLHGRAARRRQRRYCAKRYAGLNPAVSAGQRPGQPERCRSAAAAASTPRISWPRRNKLPTSNR